MSTHPKIFLIIGLGNPGEEYTNTRHNAGRVTVLRWQESEGLPEFTEIFRIFDELRQNIRTDMGLGELRRAWELARKRDSETLTYLALDTQSEGAMLTAGDIRLGRSVASTLWPKAGMFEYAAIHERIQRELGRE